MQAKANVYLEQFKQKLEKSAIKKRDSKRTAEIKGLGNITYAQLKNIPMASTEEEIRDLFQLVDDKSKKWDYRALALVKTGTALLEDEEIFDKVLLLLQDQKEDSRFRLEVLDFLKQSNFIEATFNKYMPKYLNVLRELVDDPDAAIRDDVMAVLAKKNDEYVQRRLEEGLKNPQKALVPPERAIQLLGYDIHANQYPLLREIVKNPPNQLAKIEAVRILAVDPDSKDLLLSLLKDKSELKQVRSYSALGVQEFDPEQYIGFAKSAIKDRKEYDDLKSLILVSLNQDEKIPNDSMGKEFNNLVQSFKSEEVSEDLMKASVSYRNGLT
jgi:hypothetical protein